MKKAVLTFSFLGLAPVLARAAEEGVNVIPNNFGLQLWVIATFLVMLALLAKLAFKPIAAALDRRSQTIQRSLDDADKSRADAKKLLDDYQAQLAAARVEANKLLEEARLLGDKVRKDVVEKANAEASVVVQRAQEEIQRQKERGVQELKDTVASLAVQIAGRVLEKEISQTTHRQLVDTLIKDLARMPKA